MKSKLIELPIEVAKIADNVSVEKRNDVQIVLNSVFNGVSTMRDQLDSIVVSDVNDKTNMKLANTIRLGVRQIRLDAEKTFDAKRAEVQQEMLSYKTEDSLWLKAKQIMQILTKDIEENARWKEETKERFEAEQKELKIQERIARISKVSSDITRSEFENMSDDGFEIFLSQTGEAYKAKVEAEQAERKAIEQQRIENEILKAELKARQDADLKLESDKAKAELKAKIEAEKISKEPVKKQLSIWIDSFSIAEINIENDKATLIKDKFESFKKWAKREIESA